MTQQQQAYRAVRAALKNGSLVRPSHCSKCGSPDRKGTDGRSIIHAHHADYSRPLDVEWICAQCHRYETPLPSKGRSFGEHNGQAKLTWEAVAYIRQYSSTETVSALARKFGVTRMTIRNARDGNGWLSAHQRDSATNPATQELPAVNSASRQKTSVSSNPGTADDPHSGLPTPTDPVRDSAKYPALAGPDAREAICKHLWDKVARHGNANTVQECIDAIRAMPLPGAPHE